MLYAGLKFTGLALSVAGDLAKAVRQDAERMAKELEADAAARVRLLSPALLCPTVISSCPLQPSATPCSLSAPAVPQPRQCMSPSLVLLHCCHHAPSLHAPATLCDLLMLVVWSAIHSQFQGWSAGREEWANHKECQGLIYTAPFRCFYGSYSCSVSCSACRSCPRRAQQPLWTC